MEEQNYNRNNDTNESTKGHIPETAFIIVCGVIYIVSILLLVFA